MSFFSRFPLVLLTVGALFALSVQVPCIQAAPVPNVPPVSDLAIFDTLHLVDQNDKPLTSRAFHGRLVLLNFIFTHCATSCPMQTEQLSALQQSLVPMLRDRVLLVSVSVDPDHDSPAALRAYGQMHHLDQAHWVLVTGAPAAVDKLTAHFDSLAPSALGKQVSRHTTDVRLFDAAGHFMQRYAGVPIDKQRLSREVQQLAQQTASASAANN